jgi:hypothetical protein
MGNKCIKTVKMKVEGGGELDEKKKIQLRETNVIRRRETEKMIKGVLMDMD